CQQNDKSPLAF
nr:immunoglobulin light chain junction region [Macaca mulatta]